MVFSAFFASALFLSAEVLEDDGALSTVGPTSGKEHFSTVDGVSLVIYQELTFFHSFRIFSVFAPVHFGSVVW